MRTSSPNRRRLPSGASSQSAAMREARNWPSVMLDVAETTYAVSFGVVRMRSSLAITGTPGVPSSAMTLKARCGSGRPGQHQAVMDPAAAQPGRRQHRGAGSNGPAVVGALDQREQALGGERDQRHRADSAARRARVHHRGMPGDPYPSRLGDRRSTPTRSTPTRSTWSASSRPRTATAPTSGRSPSCAAAARPATGCGSCSRRSPGSGAARCRSTSRSPRSDEARAYLAHPVLGPRLVECAAIGRRTTPPRRAGVRRHRRAEAALVDDAVPPGAPRRPVFAAVLARHFAGGRTPRPTSRL